MTIAPGDRTSVVVVIALGALLIACGPIEYVNQVTRKASSAVEGARAVNAATYSPYFYTLAVEYLHRAREEAANSDFQAANRFGRKATAAALQATSEALERAGDPSYTPGIPKVVDEKVAPAQGLAPLVPVGDGDDDEQDDEGGDEGDDEVPPARGRAR